MDNYLKMPFFIAVLYCFVVPSKAHQEGITVLKRALLDATEQEALTAYLGYNPHITEYRLSSYTDSNDTQKACTVYAHGFGESQKLIPYLLRNRYLYGTVIGFNFADTDYDPFDPSERGAKVSFAKASLGQKKDMQVLEAILVTVYKKGYAPIHIFGNSRGGGTIITTLASLYDAVIKANRIATDYFSLDDLKGVLEKIQNGGTIQLNSPLLDVSEVIKSIIDKHLKSIIGVGLCAKICSSLYITQMFKNALYYTGNYCLLPFLTGRHYSPWGAKPIIAAVQFKELDVPLFLRFNRYDEVLPDTDNARLYKILAGPKTYLIISEHGTHAKWDVDLPFQLNAFKEKYGASHFCKEDLSSDAEYTMYDQAKEFLEQAQPDSDSVQTYIESCGLPHIITQ